LTKGRNNVTGGESIFGTDPTKLPLARLMAGQWEKGAIPQNWDGKAAERIFEHLEWLLASTSGTTAKTEEKKLLLFTSRGKVS
jgi:hypothetical protein